MLTPTFHEWVPMIRNCDELDELEELPELDPEPPPLAPPAVDPVPVEPEPPALELVDVEELAATVSPTTTFTSATNPSMGEVKVAAAKLSCASVTPCSAVATVALSAASWAAAVVSSVVESVSAASSTASSSAATLALAWARVDLADARSAFSETVSMVPSSCPFLTVSPSATLTVVTRPPAPKATSSCTVGVRLPLVEMDRLSVWTDAATERVTVVGVTAAAALSVGRVNHHVAPDAAATNTIVVTIHHHRRRPRVFGCPASATLAALLAHRAHARSP